jgi:hypothetical protein
MTKRLRRSLLASMASLGVLGLAACGETQTERATSGGAAGAGAGAVVGGPVGAVVGGAAGAAGGAVLDEGVEDKMNRP